LLCDVGAALSICASSGVVACDLTAGATRLRKRVLARDRVCRCCAARASQIAHHVQPLEAGGDDDERNVIGLCGECYRAVHAAVLDAHASPALAELWRAARRQRSRAATALAVLDFEM
jgi:HNH endonuclease